MYNSILQFHELGVKKLDKIVRNYCANPNQDIGDFIMVLDEELKKLQRIVGAFMGTFSLYKDWKKKGKWRVNIRKFLSIPFPLLVFIIAYFFLYWYGPITMNKLWIIMMKQLYLIEILIGFTIVNSFERISNNMGEE